MIDGKRLRSLRNEMHITGEELGTMIGVTRQQIARYEGNQTDVTSETLIKIADFFDVSTDYLLGRSEDRASAPGQPKRGATFTIDLTKFAAISPEATARVVKALNLRVVPDPLVIDLPALWLDISPAWVARFLDEMGIDIRWSEDAATDLSPEETALVTLYRRKEFLQLQAVVTSIMIGAGADSIKNAGKRGRKPKSESVDPE